MGSPSAFAATAPAAKADSRSTPAAQPLFDQIWPQAMVAFGLGLTAVWICLLGYGLVKLIEPAFWRPVSAQEPNCIYTGKDASICVAQVDESDSTIYKSPLISH